MTENSTTYKQAGVDIAAADAFIRRIKPLLKKTERPEVLSAIGHYAGLFALKPGKYRRPVLCASTDGVGTKVKLALEQNRLEGLGQDLVAMSANDILCLGAEPLFFLDYFATGRLETEQAVVLMEGMAHACASIRCAILGGETAEMPSVYHDGDIDLAGFIVGIVDQTAIIDGKKIRPGHQIIGVASSGPHANGFSLIRKIIADRHLALDKTYPSLRRPLGEVLLEPTRLYGNPILKLIKKFSIHGIAHITGGGFDNITRILPSSCRAVVAKTRWPRPPVFQLLQAWGNIPEREMEQVFNLGIGLVLMVPKNEGAALLRGLKKMGEEAWWIGDVERRATGAPPLRVS